MESELAGGKTEENNERMENTSAQSQLKESEALYKEHDILSGFMAYRVTKQVFLVLAWIAMGLYLELVGPSLTDLKDRAHVNYEEISHILISRSTGYFMGAVFGGYICDRFNKYIDLFLSLGLFLGAAGTAPIAFFTLMPLMGCMTFLTGFGQGVLNAGGNAMVLRLWGKKAPAPMQSLHFGFGVGAMIAPQLLRPFLSKKKYEIVPSNWTINATVAKPLGLDPNVTGQEFPYNQIKDILEMSKGLNFTSIGVPVSNVSVIMAESTIEYPFLIAALYTGFLAMVVLIFYIKGPPAGLSLFQKASGNFKIISPATCAGGSMAFGCITLSLLLIYYIHLATLQKAYSRFLFAFAYESRLMSKDEAANLVTGFWVCFTAGRFLGVPVALFVPPKAMIPLQTILSTICIVIIAIWGCSNAMVLWIASCGFATFQSPLFGCGLSWSNLYLNVTSMVVCVFLMGSAVGGAIYQWAVGYIFENYAKCNMMYLIASGGFVVLGTFLIMQCIASSRGERPNIDDANEDIDTESGSDNLQLKLHLKRKE